MTAANQDIREAVKGAGVYFWQIAKSYGIAETTLCRRLREELSPEEKSKILAIIEELKGEN